ncbi:GDSL-type esterase/lipase family protein [Neobacillus sp. LXY-4]|uniref:GDSL-type esterase/lipase family protein n=1 Tax=Neobacillus sp. LXY-4 TaxID=3379826 RepID=UPI003EDFF4A9
MKKYIMVTCLILALMINTLTGCLASARELKITALGDSITFGTGDPLKKGYIGRVKEQIEGNKGALIQMSNFGVPKYTTADILTQLKDKKVRREIRGSDYIILFIGTNDLRKSAEYKFADLNHNRVNKGKHQFTQNLNLILDIIRRENSKAQIICLGLYDPYTQYRNHQEILGVINKWNSEITIAASRHKPSMFVPTIDLFSDKPKKSCFSDSLHLNAAGYELIANRLTDKLLLLESD